MRQSTPELDLESVAIVPSFATLAKRCGALPEFKSVRGYVLGADGANKSSAYWYSLQRFWNDYFHNSGGVLLDYSVLRELPRVTQGMYP
jgi:hypothetical protein